VSERKEEDNNMDKGRGRKRKENGMSEGRNLI